MIHTGVNAREMPRSILKCLIGTAFLALLALSGCAVFVPDESNTADISYLQAHFNLMHIVAELSNERVTYSVNWQSNALVVDCHVCQRSTTMVPFRGIESIYVSHRLGTYYWVNISGIGIPGGEFDSRLNDSRESEIAFVSSIYRLAHPSTDAQMASDLSKFATFARSCSTTSASGDDVTDTQRYEAEAADAVNRKEFWESIEIYHRALSDKPCWAEGHFNIAILLGESGNYLDAISEMKQYLILLPDARDAQKAQQQIWIWQARE